ncbi:MAG: hypothetical protein N4A35_00015 [Flavobacteriales bacterium]|jgi:hypothetical protein|nr:hypothetical protein [Flavobacteriales bacterium]
MILQRIRDSYVARGMAVYLSISMIFQVTYPTATFALTGGPSQPEVQSFAPVGTSDMVDLSSGDFNYNIPLLDVGGYPVNMVYNAGITMDQEASWVGLGWNINPGVINRNMRGLPDDFNGDQVKKTTYMKPHTTLGVDLGFGPNEMFGFAVDDHIGISSFGLGIQHNNYNGLSISTSLNMRANMGAFNANLGLQGNTSGGLSISPSVSYDKDLKNEENRKDAKSSTSLGLSFNTIGGLSGTSLSHTVSNERKSDKASSGSLAGTINLVPNTYTPQINQERNSLSVSFGVKIGTKLFGAKGAADIGAMYSSAWLKNNGKEVSHKAYGYLNSEHAGSRAMLDFNREKDASYNDGTTNLPITNYTYDAYSIQGQGVSGGFRPYRGEVGAVYDNTAYSFSGSANGNIDFASGNLADLGTDIKINVSNSYSGVWQQDNEALSVFRFKGENTTNFENNANDLYEPYYYKQSGELAVDHDAVFKQISGDKPVQIPLKRHGAWGVKTLPKLKEKGEDGYITHHTGNLDLQRSKRVNRNQLISTLTKAEAAVVGVRKYVVPQAPDHHVSEITVTKNDGSRYIYGIPVYNNVQKEVTFAISERKILPRSNVETGLVEYNHNTDNKPKNGRGKDEFYSKTELPPYAHSYLISEVLSHDYVDVNANGADDADYGTYTRFDYDNDLTNYKWRVPYQKDHANYDEGLKAEHQDEKASYIYGEKDVRYLKTIETKTHVAVFHTSSRTDAYEVEDENGSNVPTAGSSERTMKKLDKISLYAKGDWNTNYTNNGDYSNLTPIKEVHFEYAPSGEELCRTNLPNAQAGRGKLTLKKVYFTYGNSYKAKWSPYEFDYDGINPSYNLKGYNVWGGYKENPQQPSSVSKNNPFDLADNGVLSNPEYPYVKQDKAEEDQNAAAWALTAITLPSGGKINVNYETDDYAYVQDRRAMQMVKVVGVGETASSTPNNILFEGGVANNNYNYLFFEKLPGTNAIDYQLNSGEKEEKLYFRFLLDLDNKGHYDFVTGYCDVVPNTYGDKSATVGYVKVKNVDLKDKPISSNNPIQINPIAKAGWNYTRIHLPKIAGNQPNNLPASDGTAQGVKNLAKAIANAAMIRDVINLARGVNTRLKQNRYSQKFKQEKSWIRLTNPNGYKLGGGSRVKSITMSDEWESMVSNGAGSTSVYGQEYSYETENADEEMISSGVATYEPIQSKENPFIQPIFMTTKHLLVPDDEHFIEEPLGESFFPSPTVTYSRVTVKNIVPTGINNHKSGKVVHEFYTSKDYPTIVDNDLLTPERRSTFAKFSLVRGFQKDFMNASQGYVVINNDMNGKQKAQWVYAEGAKQHLSGVEYLYQLDATSMNMTSSTDDPFEETTVNNRPGSLNNECMLIYKDGTVKAGTIGIEYDAVADFREQGTENTSQGANAGLSTFLVGFFPGVVPSIWPTFSYSHTRFRSAVFTKVINQHGILREVVAHDLGAKVSTKNLAWDAETGEVLLTSVKNEYADEIYTLNYPAHWGYDKMGLASENIGLETNIQYVSAGKYYNNKAAHYFVKGDEVLLKEDGGNHRKAWVLSVDESTNHIYLIDKSGNLIEEFIDNGNTHAADYNQLKVVRSGRRNQQALAIGSITMKQSPIKPNGSGGYYSIQDVITSANTNQNQILAASAVEYDDNWRTYGNGTDCGTTEKGCAKLPVNTIVNPFLMNIQGAWRTKKSSLFLGERNQTNTDVYGNTPNASLDLRKDGSYSTFTPFWNYNTTEETWEGSGSGWTWASLISNYTPYGQEVENKDALARYSAAVFGYNHSLAIAVANNARQNQIAFDGFEDYAFDSDDACLNNKHFGFECYTNAITSTQAHSGRNSIMVNTVYTGEGQRSVQAQGTLTSILPSNQADDIPYTVKSNDIIAPFGPSTVFNADEIESSQTAVAYVFSYWQKELRDNNEVLDYSSIQPSIKVNGVEVLGTPYAKGKIIDGWQKVTYSFEIQNGTTGDIVVKFEDPMGTVPSYVDDIRIHPFNSSMKTYVYDPLSLRLWAELDDNNYATFYEYDEEGKLLRIKKETERGIQTIQESRSSSVK